MPRQNFATFAVVRERFADIEFRRQLDPAAAVFVKSSVHDSFTSEVAGLEALRGTDSIRVAEVIGIGSRDGEHLLVLEAIESRKPTDDFFERFARKLAAMHRHPAPSNRFGFPQDNFLGATPQRNQWQSNWVEFWVEQRLGFQLALADDSGHGGQELQQLGERIKNRLGELIGNSEEQPALIHGDLWSGNWICDAANEVAIIDPAAYYAHREAEFGMTTLYGGLPKRFYDAYHEAAPLQQGWQERVAIYRLYHLLNHLNLFGVCYLGQCLELMRRYQ